MNKKITIYNEALEKFGIKMQLGMVVEECSELQHAIMKMLRNGLDNPTEQLTEEVADVEIMLEQLHNMFKADFSRKVEINKSKKLDRLQKILDTKMKCPICNKDLEHMWDIQYRCWYKTSGCGAWFTLIDHKLVKRL